MTILSKYEDQWLGDKQIKFIESSEPSKSGVELVNVVFNDGSRQQYSKLLIEQEGVVTPQIQDLTEFRDRRVFPVVKDILKLLRDYNVDFGEVDYLLAKVAASLNENRDKAEKGFWGVERLDKVSIIQIDNALLSHQPTLKDVL